MAEDQPHAIALQWAAELILEDERLTADLEDAEADALLAWALPAAERAVDVRLRSGEPVDHEAVAEAVQPVRRVARAINDLVAGHAAMGRYELLVQLLGIVDAACRLTPVPTTSPNQAPPA